MNLYEVFDHCSGMFVTPAGNLTPERPRPLRGHREATLAALLLLRDNNFARREDVRVYPHGTIPTN